ncbi:MAG: bifunctional DNA-formamidopyrimidine glycosylase/DNA-(apurinic or apyrimidinic site) lyase [Gammaproteobacteria bacterium]|nr:bifunctional DNA-formamidopyrimidine glycosylase/DNA-(apurinic or apyrimidinic site) lyase [Gammaproteobacteria bacterium]
MPELPEVETTRRGIEPAVSNAVLTDVQVRNPNMRWRTPTRALKKLIGQRIVSLQRRAKYLLLGTESDTILLHLGMSGSLHVLPTQCPPGKHDHLDLEFDHKTLVRFNDPRRFGCCLVLKEPVQQHKLLAGLGPEPLSDEFDGGHLKMLAKGRRVAVKNFIMDGRVVVGVGNIYASEALYRAGIRPGIAAGGVSAVRYSGLATAIKDVLADAIRAGGTTLNDFSQADGKPGYFRHELQVYGREGQPCLSCSEPIRSRFIGQRNSYYCSICQR